MASNAILFGWDRPVAGREQLSAAHFRDFIEYLDGLQSAGEIQSWQNVFLDPHGGDMNGFFLIVGSPEQISRLIVNDTWTKHMTRAGMHLSHPGAVTCATGDLVMERFAQWSSLIPG